MGWTIITIVCYCDMILCYLVIYYITATKLASHWTESFVGVDFVEISYFPFSVKSSLYRIERLDMLSGRVVLFLSYKLTILRNVQISVSSAFFATLTFLLMAHVYLSLFVLALRIGTFYTFFIAFCETDF